MDWIANIFVTVIQAWISWQSGLSVVANLWLIAKASLFWTGIFLLASFLLWGFFIGGMNIQRVYEKRKKEYSAGTRKNIFTPIQWIFAAPFIAFAVIIDVLYRYTFGIICFFPYFRGFFSDVTFSKELEAIMGTRIYIGTRNYKVARWIAANLINPFSYDGEHIRMPFEPKENWIA